MATQNLDAVNLGAVPVGGYIREDLMDKIFSIDPIDRPFCDSTGSTTAENTFKEWVMEDLEDATANNAVVDGADAAGNDTRTGERVGNYSQIASKVVRVSDRGRQVDTVGSSDELIRQLMRRQKGLKRDEEATYCSNNIAVPGDGATVAGQTAGIGGWIGTGQGAVNTDRGASGVDPILSGNPGGYPTTKAVAGTKRALSETSVKNMMRAAYEKGGNPTVAMSTPAVIEVLSDYLFSSSARIATLQSEVSQGNRTDNGSGGGRSTGGIVAQGAVNVFVTNYGTLVLTPNRFQPDSAAGAADLFLLDTELWERAYLQGYETKDLARTGTAENRQITVDFNLCSLNESGSAIVADIDYAIPAVV